MELESSWHTESWIYSYIHYFGLFFYIQLRTYIWSTAAFVGVLVVPQETFGIKLS